MLIVWKKTTWRKKLGAFLISLPFIMIAIYIIKTDGILAAVYAFTFTGVIIICIYAGTALLYSRKKG